MAKEVEKSINHIYNAQKIFISGECSKKIANAFKEYNFYNTEYKKQDKPDIVIINNEEIIGIEHFEFDDYLKKRKRGSLGREFFKRSEQEFKNEAKNYKSYKKIIDIEKQNIPSGYEYYVKNFIQLFQEHYEKIDIYKNNIANSLEEIDLEKNIKLYFLIETKNSLMPRLINENGMDFQLLSNKDVTNYYLPFNSKEIRDLIEKSNKIDGIIFDNTEDENIPLIFIYSFKDCNIKQICQIYPKTSYFSYSQCHQILYQEIIDKEIIENIMIDNN